MSDTKLDLFAIFNRYGFVCGDQDSDCSKARAAVADLIAADWEYDSAHAAYNKAPTGKARNDMWDRCVTAKARRAAALARISGEPT